jgi:outer membrane protein TolC
MTSGPSACLALVLLAAFPWSALAQAPPAVTVTLGEAVDRALSESHRLAEVRARTAGAAAVRDGARAASRPELDVVAGYTRTNHVEVFGVPLPDGRLRVIYPDLPNNLTSRLDLRWPLYTAGQTRALAAAAAADASALGRDERAVRADLTLEVTRRYWAALVARENVRLVRESRERIALHLADVRARAAAGLAPPNEVSTVDAEHALADARLVEAETTNAQALTALRRLLGVDLDTPLALAEAVAPPAATAIPPDPDEARRNRPERHALALRQEAADARVEAAESEARPRILLQSGVDYARPNPRRFPRVDEWRESWDVGVSVRWPLFDGGRVKARVDAARAASRAVAEQLADLDRQLDADARTRSLELDAASYRLAAFDRAVSSARESVRVTRERYRAGVAINTEVVDAEGRLLAAELDRMRAIVDARLAAAELDRSLGR